MGKKNQFERDDSWESNFLPGKDNILELSPYKNKYIFELNLGGYRESKFQNPPFYQHFLADMTICEIRLYLTSRFTEVTYKIINIVEITICHQLGLD